MKSWLRVWCLVFLTHGVLLLLIIIIIIIKGIYIAQVRKGHSSSSGACSYPLVAGMRRRHFVDQYLLHMSELSSKPAAYAAAVDPRDRRTPDHYIDPALCTMWAASTVCADDV